MGLANFEEFYRRMHWICSELNTSSKELLVYGFLNDACRALGDIEIAER